MVNNDPTDAAMRIGLCLRRKATTSAKVYFPRFLNGSATRNIIKGHPTRKPIEYIRPSYPFVATIPAIPRKEAALI